MKQSFHKKYLLAFIFLLPILSANAQLDSTLLRRVAGLTKLSDIIREADSYLNPRIRRQASDDPYFKQSKLLHRWALYMSNRLTGEGHITDVNRRNLEALDKYGLTLNGGTKSTARDINLAYGNWGFVGPSSLTNADLRLGIGRCDRIAFHPTDPNTIYIGTPAGGLWRTINDGASWTSLTHNLPSLGISGIVVHYNSPQTLFVLTGDGDSDMGGFVSNFGYLRSSTGVYKSTDGGATWSATGPLSNGSYTGYKLVQDPDEPNTMLAATSVGVYRTTNGGTSWTRTTNNIRTYDIEYDPNNPDRVYVAGNGQVLYSTNSGDDWTAATFDISIAGAGRVELAVTPNNTAYVYALTGRTNENVNGVFSGLYRSTDNGVSFDRRCNTPNIMDGSKGGTGDGSQGSYDLALAVSPSNAQRVLTGGVNIWSSTNGGTNMSAIMFDGDNRKIHVDIHDLKYSPLNGALYCANDGGVYKSTDNGDTWTKISDDLNVSQIYHMGGIATNSAVIGIGMQDNGVKARTSFTTSFNHNGSGDGFAIAIRSDDDTKGYAGINKNVYTLDLNSGMTTERGPRDEWYPTLAVHPTTSTTVYAGYTAVYKSTNGGVDYTNKGANGSWSMATCPSNTSRIYAAGGANGYSNDNNTGALRRSDNNGDDWTNVFNSSDATFNKITCVAVDPSNSQNVWVTLGGYNEGQKVYRSTNSGGNWTNVSGSLPNIPVNCIAVDASNNAYIGTDFGVFYRGATQSNWTPFFNGMPRVPVTDLIIYESSSLIRASTFGRGIYSANTYSTCVQDLALNASYNGLKYYEASDSISSVGNVTGGAGTQIFFKAGNSVTFKEGFDVTAGNEFRAYIGSCGNGIPVMSATDYQTAAKTSPETLPFATVGSIEVGGAGASGFKAKINVKQSADLKMVLIDEAGNVLYENKVVIANKDDTAKTINYNLQKGKTYKAMLVADGNVVHWQEVSY